MLPGIGHNVPQEAPQALREGHGGRRRDGDVNAEGAEMTDIVTLDAFAPRRCALLGRFAPDAAEHAERRTRHPRVRAAIRERLVAGSVLLSEFRPNHA